MTVDTSQRLRRQVRVVGVDVKKEVQYVFVNSCWSLKKAEKPATSPLIVIRALL
jgi:hypothetical protein